EPASYFEFLRNFRELNRRNMHNRGRYSITYDGASFGSGKSGIVEYFFEAPNFKLVGYALNGSAPKLLSSYSHVRGVGTVGAARFHDALLTGGEGRLSMNKELSMVVALTSEAARSYLVGRNIKRTLENGIEFNFSNHELLFTNYGKTMKNARLGNPGQACAATWRPMMDHDYAMLFFSAEGRQEYHEFIKLKGQ
ncbi:MAG: hypothetical protein ACPGRD_04025, partial [Planktomarina sp.]